MPAATRVTDNCTGHDGFPPRPLIDGSPDVYTNGLKQGRETDPYDTHSDGDSSHSGQLAQGSSTVYVNGLQAGRVGDPVSCGSDVMEGSSDVFIGG